MAKEITIKEAKNILPKRPQESNKATFGKILNIAGSKFYQGAAYLSSVSALKVGAGYLTLACPDCILNNIVSKSSDITFLPLRSFKDESIASDNAKMILETALNYNAISLGCGLSTNSSTVEFVDKFLQGFNLDIPLVIDADGLNAISQIGTKRLPQNTIITPHPKELSRLLDVEPEEINDNREYFAQFASEKYKAIVVLKGNKTVIADYNKNVFINQTGNSALAKAGTGDVLTGIITGLLAQKIDLLNAAVLATFIHGLCGELASKEMTEYGVLASDLINYIPKSLLKIIN